MYWPLRQVDLSYAQAFRYLGRCGAVMLFLTWLSLFVTETIKGTITTPTADMFLQAAAFGVVFVGYALAWKHELLGGLLAIAGTIAFFAVSAVTFGVHTILPLSETALFAAPGILFLLAAACDRTHQDKYRGAQ